MVHETTNKLRVAANVGLDLAAQNQELMTRLERFEAEQHELHERMITLECERRQWQEESFRIDDLDNRVVHVKTAVAQLHDVRSALESKLTDISKRLDMLQSEHNNMAQTVSDMAQSRAREVERASQLQKSVSWLTSEQAASSEQQVELCDQMARFKGRVASQQAETAKHVRDIQTRLRLLDDNYRAALNDIRDLGARNRQVEGGLASVVNEFQSLLETAHLHQDGKYESLSDIMGLYETPRQHPNQRRLQHRQSVSKSIGATPLVPLLPATAAKGDNTTTQQQQQQQQQQQAAIMSPLSLKEDGNTDLGDDMPTLYANLHGGLVMTPSAPTPDHTTDSQPVISSSRSTPLLASPLPTTDGGGRFASSSTSRKGYNTASILLKPSMQRLSPSSGGRGGRLGSPSFDHFLPPPGNVGITSTNYQAFRQNYRRTAAFLRIYSVVGNMGSSGGGDSDDGGSKVKVGVVANSGGGGGEGGEGGHVSSKGGAPQAGHYHHRRRDISSSSFNGNFDDDDSSGVLDDAD
ncbi:hypothetical protein EV182_001731 [Spiromyces aspiralis]|uniref:Uncharacterized protein n=1 Tax=Spiromyces aspiralis TaxID=68401 RepID=A0ACC1HJA1_9FUNG|nr:hypothetical protein EV182_001731 [Spiromyces aspiralis]